MKKIATGFFAGMLFALIVAGNSLYSNLNAMAQQFGWLGQLVSIPRVWADLTTAIVASEIQAAFAAAICFGVIVLVWRERSRSQASRRSPAGVME